VGRVAGGYRTSGLGVARRRPLPPEAENDWVVVSANWVNPAANDLDAVFLNNYGAAKNAIKAAMLGLPRKEDVFAAAREVSNPFYTPRPL
jgi:5,6,7,8-tetrahydromethanopterin hydro-lyase